MKKWKLFIGLILIFALGVVVGSLGNQMVHKQRFERMRKDPGARKAFFLNRLSRNLDLTEEQKQMFEQIIARMDEKRREHFIQGRLQIKEIIEDGFARMRKELTPEQQRKLDEFQERTERFLRRSPRGLSPSKPE